MSNPAHASAQKRPPNNPTTPSANNVLTPRSHPTPSTGHPTQTNSPSAVRTAASPAHRAGLHNTHLAGKSPAQHTPTPGRHAATKSLLGAATATSSPSGGRPASSQHAAATMASAPSTGSNALHIPSNFGSPAGLGSLGLGSGLGMSMSLSGMGFSMSNTGASQLDEQERARRLEHVVALLGQGHGRLSRENLERLGRRYGFEEVIGDYFLKNEDTTLYFAGGNHVVVEIECEDKMSSVVKKVGVTFSNLNDAVTEHQDAAGKVFKMDLIPPANSSNFNMSLDKFANNLERLSRLHQLSVPGANCFEAITGLFNSLRKLFEHDKKQRQKEDAVSDSRSAWKLDREVTCKRCGRPRMHARRRYGLSLDYWMHGRMIPPPAEQQDQQEADSAAEDTENMAALVIECDYTAPATVYPRIRVTDQWIAEQMRKPREEADNMSTASPEEGHIDWLDPDPALIPAVEPSASSAGAASRSGQAKAHFVAKFEPPLMLPVGIATEIYAAVGLHLDLHDALNLADTILADNLPQGTPLSVPLEITRDLRRSRDSEDETEEFRLRLFRQKQDLGSKLAQLPFQHPRQVIAILPILRQWALTAKLLQNTFTSKMTSGLHGIESTSNRQKWRISGINGHTRPSRTIEAELADLLDGTTAEHLTLDIELRVTNGLPQFTVTIPGPTWPRIVSFEVRPNADVVVGQQNLVDRGASDFEKKIKGLTEALTDGHLRHKQATGIEEPVWRADMAGMEQLEIHSKSYLVRWMNVSSHFTISWSIQPHKKSISFGVFKHPGGATTGASPGIVNGSHFEQTISPAGSAGTPPADGGDYMRARRLSQVPPLKQQEQSTNAYEKLESLGMKAVAWPGRCEADRVTMGSYDVPDGEGGMYGLIFDNTHSKTLGKMVTVVIMAYPTSAPPKSGHIHMTQALSTRKASGASPIGSPALKAVDDPVKSTHRDSTSTKVMFEDPRPRSKHAQELTTSTGSTFYTGVLSKKRRKRNQGYARRFFSLDFTSSTLSYFKSKDSLALRGAIPLSLAVIGANEKTRQISVDSGAEIWLLKAHHRKEFDGWKQALERASQSPGTPMSPARPSPISSFQPRPSKAASAGDEREWDGVETLVGRTAGIRDALRRLAQGTEPKQGAGLGISGSGSPSPSESAVTEYFDTKGTERPSFWRRKSSSSRGQSPNMLRSQQSPVPSKQPSGNSLAPPSAMSPQPINLPKRQDASPSSSEGVDLHKSCLALLKDLDSVVAEFSSLIAERKSRRTLERPPAISRLSGDSSVFQEFFDAEEGSTPQLLKLGRQSEEGDEGEEEDEPEERDDASIATGSESSDDEAGDFSREGHAPRSAFFPAKAKSLSPLPKDTVARRNNVKQSNGSPPSLISFLRKNVGKDLSTIAMPVTANEPLSLLQRQAEDMQHSELLDSAASPSTAPQQRILYIMAFAISSLSSSRAKERAIRKPFNPMLGETFEMVREDRGFRFLAEKVSHRPVRVACQAESAAWTFTFAPAPSQKFWGKSAELITNGRARVVLHASGLCYSWNPATCFLRNIIAGEKYVEPVQTFSVVEETSGEKATASFKAGGMFSGRSEEVTVQAYDASGNVEPLGLTGKWTSHLTITSTSSSPDDGKEIWRAGPLVSNAERHYGMTEFAATLNEITALEENALPPTDSRLRPDQRAYEDGVLDEAEKLKLKLEEAQRRRRKEMETAGEAWEPRWFEKVGNGEDGEEVWRLKEKDGYWDVRSAVVGFKGGKWDGVREVFDTS